MRVSCTLRLALLAAIALAGCDPAPCVRMSDCASGLVCSPTGRCSPPPTDGSVADALVLDAGPIDAGRDAALDAPVDAAVDAGLADAGEADATLDGSLADAAVDGAVDAAPDDASVADAGSDAGTDDAGADAP